MATAKTKTVLVAACALLLIGGGAVGVTKLLTSSGPRRVVVNPTVATAGAATPRLRPTPQAVTFGQGTTIELLYVSDEPRNASRWWSADGTPVAPPSPVPGVDRISLGGGGPAHLLVLRKTDPVGAYPSMTVTIGRANVSGAASTEDQSGGTRLHSFLFTTRGAAPAVVDVRVGLASGPWSEVQRYPLAPPADAIPRAATATTTAAAARTTTSSTAPASSDADAAALVIGNVRDGKDGPRPTTEVEFRWASDAHRFRDALDEKIVLVTTDGRELYAQSWSSRAGGPNVLSFAVPRSQAAALAYQSRPYETREIRNVSLRPGQKTAVAIGAAPALPPPPPPPPRVPRR